MLRTDIDTSLEYFIPIRSPAAPGSQYGASKPENAVTKYIPPVSFSFAAKSLTSAAELTMPMVSRSHFMALPATATKRHDITRKRSYEHSATHCYLPMRTLASHPVPVDRQSDQRFNLRTQTDPITYRAQEPVVTLHNFTAGTEQ